MLALSRVDAAALRSLASSSDRSSYEMFIKISMDLFQERQEAEIGNSNLLIPPVSSSIGGGSGR